MNELRDLREAKLKNLATTVDMMLKLDMITGESTRQMCADTLAEIEAIEFQMRQLTIS